MPGVILTMSPLTASLLAVRTLLGDTVTVVSDLLVASKETSTGRSFWVSFDLSAEVNILEGGTVAFFSSRGAGDEAMAGPTNDEALAQVLHGIAMSTVASNR